MIKVEINNIDVSNKIEWNRLTINKRLFADSDVCNFRIIEQDLTVSADELVEVFDDEDKIFKGKVKTISRRYDDSVAIADVECKSNLDELDRILVEEIFVNKTVTEIITSLRTNYFSGFDISNVTDDTVIERIRFDNLPVSECLTRLARIAGKIWFVNPDDEIFFFEFGDISAPFNLTDTNDKYYIRTLDITEDLTQIKNRVFVQTKGTILADKADNDSISEHGVKQYIERNDGIEKIAEAEQLADALLEADKLPRRRASYITKENGLLPGQKQNIQSDIRDFNDDFIVYSVGFSAYTPLDFEYHIECKTEREVNLIDILKEERINELSANPRFEKSMRYGEGLDAYDAVRFIDGVFDEVDKDLEYNPDNKRHEAVYVAFGRVWNFRSNNNDTNVFYNSKPFNDESLGATEDVTFPVSFDAEIGDIQKRVLHNKTQQQFHFIAEEPGPLVDFSRDSMIIHHRVGHANRDGSIDFDVTTHKLTLENTVYSSIPSTESSWYFAGNIALHFHRNEETSPSSLELHIYDISETGQLTIRTGFPKTVASGSDFRLSNSFVPTNEGQRNIIELNNNKFLLHYRDKSGFEETEKVRIFNLNTEAFEDEETVTGLDTDSSLPVRAISKDGEVVLFEKRTFDGSKVIRRNANGTYVDITPLDWTNIIDDDGTIWRTGLTYSDDGIRLWIVKVSSFDGAEKSELTYFLTTDNGDAWGDAVMFNDEWGAANDRINDLTTFVSPGNFHLLHFIDSDSDWGYILSGAGFIDEFEEPVVVKTDASDIDGVDRFVGFTREVGVADEEKPVQLLGMIEGFNNLSPGRKYYLSNTPGQISTSPGTHNRIVGIALSDHSLLLIRGGVTDALIAHVDDKNNPHEVTASQVGAPTLAQFNNHSERHESGGDDELNLTGLIKNIEINEQTDDYQLVLSDNNKLVDMNKASNVDLIVPHNTTVNFPIGAKIIVRQKGEGNVIIDGDVDVVIQSSAGTMIKAQHDAAVLIKIATNTWWLFGETEEAPTGS